MAGTFTEKFQVNLEHCLWVINSQICHGLSIFEVIVRPLIMMTYVVGQLCITMYFSINDPTAYIICSIYSISVFPYFVTLNCVKNSTLPLNISRKVHTHSLHFFGNWSFKLWALIVLKNIFLLHRHFNKRPNVTSSTKRYLFRNRENTILWSLRTTLHRNLISCYNLVNFLYNKGLKEAVRQKIFYLILILFRSTFLTK